MEVNKNNKNDNILGCIAYNRNDDAFINLFIHHLLLIGQETALQQLHRIIKMLQKLNAQYSSAWLISWTAHSEGGSEFEMRL